MGKSSCGHLHFPNESAMKKRMKQQKRVFFLLILIVLAIGGGLYWGLALFHNPIVVDRVILITIDTLRADHLQAYGYIHETAPFFERMAKEGILFKNTVAPMSTTTPSHASLFTALYPLQHGVLKNGHLLSDDFLTMAEIFQEMGYKTAGIVSTVGHFKAGNLHQGFEYFNKPPKGTYSKEMGWYRGAKDTIDAAIEWLNTLSKNEKFFLWVHLFDPHTPLLPPKAHYEPLKALVERDTEQFYSFLVEQQRIEEDFFNKPAQMMIKITRYDAEIHYADAEIQRFYEHYQSKEWDTKNLWVITADHGEGLGNHNWGLHGKYIYNEQLRIPLLFYFSSGAGKGRVVEELVENVDIFPTVLELVKNETPLSSAIQGKSLLPLMFPQQNRTYSKEYAFSQRRIYDNKAPEKIIPEKTNYEDGEKYALQSKEYKYIYHTIRTDEFFDLRTDPYEINNLINSGSAEEQQLRTLLLEKIERLKEESASEQLLVDEETIEQLKSLGYTQ